MGREKPETTGDVPEPDAAEREDETSSLERAGEDVEELVEHRLD
ncbi:hypothetical protein [Oceanitalea stevensii]|nr:hypothetical protein [Oceanitalea stevensii]